MSTVRQAVLMNAIADGMPVSKAGELAGYKSRHNAHDVYRSMRDRMADVMDTAGLTERVIAERLRDQLYATKTVTATFMGQITDSLEIADNQAIGKAIETAAKIRGMVDIGDGGSHIGTVNIMWAGGLPAWAGKDNRTVTDAEIVKQANQSVTETEGVPISTVEGTGIGPGPSTHMHSGNSTVLERVNTAKRKRGPRLPVLGGKAKP